MVERLTAEERLTLKTGALGAVFLVSNADPGMVAVIRESFAASGALADTSGVVKEALTTVPLPKMPRDPAQIESVVLPVNGAFAAYLEARVRAASSGRSTRSSRRAPSSACS